VGAVESLTKRHAMGNATHCAECEESQTRHPADMIANDRYFELVEVASCLNVLLN
jgi:hypothetical protein